MTSGPADLAAIELVRVRLPLVRPFTTSFGTTDVKEAILVRSAGADGVVGWGECAAANEPRYSGEWNDGAWLVLRDFLAPAALAGRPHGVRGHPMARAALETSLLDLRLRRDGVGLAEHLGGVRDRIECGISLGIEESTTELLNLIAAALDRGYRRVKLKIAPGRDLAVVRAVREAFPDAPLTVDANAAYTLADADRLAELDAFGLGYVEQPLEEDRLAGHAQLQLRLRTPVCLDETVTSAVVAEEAVRLGACRVINLKVGRVGGLTEGLAIHELATSAGVPLWCGGMLETGVGRAVNVALASLPGFTLPGDTSASDRYFARDLTDPFLLEPDGTMAVPRGPGIGVEPDPGFLDAVTVARGRIDPRD